MNIFNKETWTKEDKENFVAMKSLLFPVMNILNDKNKRVLTEEDIETIEYLAFSISTLNGKNKRILPKENIETIEYFSSSITSMLDNKNKEISPEGRTKVIKSLIFSIINMLNGENKRILTEEDIEAIESLISSKGLLNLDVIYGLGLEGTEYLSEFLKKNPVSKLDEIHYSTIYPGKHLSLWWEVDREKRRLEKINLLKNSTTESVDEVLSK